MMKEKYMFPMFSMRALPTGYCGVLPFFAVRLHSIKVTFETGSKMESAIVVKEGSSDEDPELLSTLNQPGRNHFLPES